MSSFHPTIDAWFSGRFGAPTAVQARAWPVIAAGRDALVMAPTGSGKTLAAFLACLDRLVRSADSGALEDGTEILYVSPLKALSNDVQRNLDEPLSEIGDVAVAMGLTRPGIRTAVRTGDTQASARRAAAKHPPHVLVTTPESLFILLTSESGRRGLCKVRTVIVDEIHALCADKRGAHLALSLARLDRLVRAEGLPRPQRVGLSATVRPIEVAMRMLVGAARPDPEVIDAGSGRDLDLAIEVPKDELGAVATNEQWAELYDRIAALAREHRSTLVFVNTRRLVERVAFHLSERLGEAKVAAHHGSLSRARRFDAERRLKAGELSVVVATASLELGIDVGAVDLACLVGSSRSIATAIQRIGRSGHALAATPKGRFFPLTRDQLIECAAIVRAARRGVLDEVAMRKAPLDILAQQIVATASAEAISENDLFALAREAAQYGSLERREFDAVVEMLSEGIAVRNGRAGALLHRDAVAGVVRGRRGARIAALTSGGAIPDNANYDVVLEPDETKVGTIDEDFAIESMAGDVFLLGTTSWRIRRVEAGKVRVEDAKGAAPSIPFWLGEGPARTAELSREVAALRIAVDEIAEKEHDGEALPGATAEWLVRECALDLRGAELARDYVRAAKSALGALPTQDTIIAERFFDEAGGMQLVLHAPFGGRINRAFGMALRKSFCRQFDFELQAAATDDGILLSLSPQHSFPLESIFGLVRADRIEEVLTQAALQAPMFGTRWRWNATRSLALLRFRNGKRVPPPLLRMRSDDLLAAVFPAQTECQDNHGGAPIELPDHPLVSETVRDCLTEAMDAEGLRLVLGRIARGEIRCVARETAEPSVLSHEILNANPYAFLDDAPLEERRSRAVNVRRGLPADLAERIGGLDQSAIDAVIAEAEPDPRDEDELHDLLLDLGFLPEEDAIRRGFGVRFEALVRARRASRLLTPKDVVWVAAERRSLGVAAFPDARFDPELEAPAGTRGANAMDHDAAIAEAVRAHLAIMGPVTEASLASALGLDEGDVAIALAKIEGDGAVLRGRFSEALAAGELEWCDRRLLARIHRRTVDRLRREIEPATAAQLIRFLLAWQHAKPVARLHGRLGLERVIGELQGFELAAGAWEREVLPARVEGYEPGMLDALCLSGEIAWGRLSPRDVATSTPTRAAPIALARRSDLPWLLAPREGKSEAALSLNAAGVLTRLRDAGASFQDEIAPPDLGAAAIEDALWELVSAGWVTSDGFGALRSLLAPKKRSAADRYATNPGPRRHIAAGRWALLRSASAPDDEALEALARQYVKRYGVVFRDLLAREPRAPAWRDLVRVYRRLEMRGELRGGRLVGGFVGEQFASPQALEALRAIRREPETGQVVRLSACDPLNLVGIITPGPRVPAALGAYVNYRDGVPVEDEAPIVATPLREHRFFVLHARRRARRIVTPSPADLAELAAKYEKLAELRRTKERDGTVPERAGVKALATRFPGALNELDTLTLEEIDARAEALGAAAQGGALAPWMAWIHGYHTLLRAALGIKARTARARTMAKGRVETLAHDASLETGFALDSDFVRAVVKPMGGRILPVVYARLAVEHGVGADEIADALFPRRRARRPLPL